MVILNSKQEGQGSRVKGQFSHLRFSHVVKLPRANRAIVTAKDKQTGKTHNFLIMDESQQVYQRNGLKSSWELQLDEEARELTQYLNRSLKEDRIPCYTT